jgi:predicted MFS family arabinose efflux permease
VLVSFSVLAGSAYTFSRVAAGPFYMQNSTATERTHLFSFSFGVQLLAGMVGSLGAGRLVAVCASLAGSSILGYRYTLYGGIAVGLLSVVPFSMIASRDGSLKDNRIVFSRAVLKRRWPFYFKISFSNFLIGLGAGLIIPFLNLYFRNRFGMTPAEIGTFYFCTVLMMFVGTLLGPVLARRFGLIRTIVFSQLASIPFMLVLAYTYSLPLAFMAYVMRAGLMNMGVPIATNFGMEMSEDTERGMVNALLMVSWTAAWMVSAAVGGSLIERYGFTLTFNITIAMYVMSSLFYFWSFRNSERRPDGTGGWTVPEEESA